MIHGQGGGLDGAKVLIADDDGARRQSMAERLQALGCRVSMVEDGCDVLSRVAGDRPDLILLDTFMQRLDGYRTRALLADNPAFREIPVVMLCDGDDLFEGAALDLVDSVTWLANLPAAEELSALLARVLHARG